VLKEKNKDRITKNTTLGEIVQKYPEAVPVLFEHGLHCIGCHAAMYETLEQGAIAHGIDVDKLLKKINKIINQAMNK